METVNIIFNDGTELEAERNGSSFIVNEKPDFPEEFTNITIEDEDGETIIDSAELIECASIDGRYWFSFREITERETTENQLEAQVFYTATMTDTLME